MAGGQVNAHRRAERHARHVGPLDPDCAQEGGDLVGMAVGRVRSWRLVALARAGKVDRDAAEVLGVRRQLERVAGVVRGRVRDQQERLALPLHLVVDREPVHLNLRHGRSLLALRWPCRVATPSLPPINDLATSRSRPTTPSGAAALGMGWSVYGAERSQPVATGGKWRGREDRSNRRKALPWVATGCR